MSSNPDGGSISTREIAQWDDWDWSNWYGIIDELRIWNRVLTAKEVTKNMWVARDEILSIEPIIG